LEIASDKLFLVGMGPHSSHVVSVSICMKAGEESCADLPRSVLWAFAVCLLLRLIYLALLGNQLTAYYYEHTFAIQAINLLQGRGLQVHDDYLQTISDIQLKRFPTLVQPREYPPYPQDHLGYYHATDMPGYPWFLAGVWRVVGPHSFWPIKGFQAIASAFLIFLVWDMARRLFDSRTGVWAAWLYAAWLPLAYLSQMVSKEAAEGLLMIPATWFLLRFLMEARYRDLVGCALAFTCAVFMRTNLILLPGALCVLGLLIFPWRRCAMALAAFCLVLVMALIPWVHRNKQFVDPGVGVKEGFYWALIWNLASVDPALKAEISKYEAMRSNPDGTLRKMMRPPPELEPLSKKVLQERRGLFLKLGALQLLRGPWSRLEWGFEIFPAGSRSYAEFHSLTGGSRSQYLMKYPHAVLFKILARVMELVVSILSLFCFWVRRREWKQVLWVATCYGVFLCTYAFVHLEFRYIVPHTWPLLILAGASLSRIFQKSPEAAVKLNLSAVSTPVAG